MKFFYVSYYMLHLDYPNSPCHIVKFDHKPTYDEIKDNQPKPAKIMEGYAVHFRYEVTVDGELCVSRWQCEEIFTFFEKEE